MSPSSRFARGTPSTTWPLLVAAASAALRGTIARGSFRATPSMSSEAMAVAPARAATAATAGAASPRASVRIGGGTASETVSVALRLEDETAVNLMRPMDEPVSTALRRLGLTVAKKLGGGKGKRAGGRKADAAQADAQCTLVDSDGSALELRDDMLHPDVWRTGQRLLVGGLAYRVVVNPPSVSVALPYDGRAPCFVGSVLAPPATSEFAEEVEWSWWRVRDEHAEGGELVSRARAYTPRAEDVGWQLRVEATAVRGPERSDAARETFARPVQPLPRLGALALRGAWLSRARAPAGAAFERGAHIPIRAISYNLLADWYASQPSSAERLFAHVSAETLGAARRLTLAAHELRAHDADLACLQEVDCALYEHTLEPTMAACGYEGSFVPKSNGAKEGCALFWRRERFEAEAVHAWPVAELVRDDLLTPTPAGAHGADAAELAAADASARAVRALIAEHAELEEVLMRRVGTVAQAVVLRVRAGGDGQRRLVVGNTHLFFHPQADHVRLLQVHALLSAIARLKRELAAAHGRAPAHLLCGDLNSCPRSGAVQLLADGHVPAEHEAWADLHTFAWGDRGALEPPSAPPRAGGGGTELTPPPAVRAPAGIGRHFAATGMPAFTNFVPGFVECLDYVWASADDFAPPEPSDAAPTPTRADIEADGSVALPAPPWPSDHVSVACELRLRP